jgi:WD40 repeat protein
VAFSPKGGFIATGSRDKLVAVWDTATGDRLQTLAGPQDEVRVVAVSPDEKLLAAGCRGGLIHIWCLPEFAEDEIVGGFSGLPALAFLPNGNLVFSNGNGRLVVREVSATSPGVIFTPVPRGRIVCGAFSSDGSILCALDSGHPRIVYRWKLTDDGANELEPLSAECDATTLAVSSHNLLAVGDSTSATVHLFDLASGRSMGSLAAPYKASMVCATFSFTGERLAIGCGDGSVIVWDVNTRKILVNPVAHKGGVRDLSVSATMARRCYRAA